MKRSADFEAGVAAALANASLQAALADVPAGFVAGRARVKAAMPEFEALRRTGRDIRDHTLAHLDAYLEMFERNAVGAGAQVHWAENATDACDIILGICRDAGARVVTKSKSMVSEEVGLRPRLEEAALEVVETDLGEYIIQIRGETPSHIIAPAIHLRAGEVADDFRRRHAHLAADRDLSAPEALVGEARGVLRDKFLAAEVGITGANFLIAETGSAIVVTNEGNADLTMSLPKVHIVLASIDKVVPTLERRLAAAAAACPLGDRAGVYRLHDVGHRAATAGRPRRTRDVSRGAPRQRALRAAGLEAAPNSALHSLRRLHEPLPGVLRHRRSRLRLGVSRTHRGGAVAGARRSAGGRSPGAGFDLLRPLRGGMPRRDPAGVADASLARNGHRRAGIAAEPGAAARLGVARPPSTRLPSNRQPGGAHAGRCRTDAWLPARSALWRRLDALP